MALAHILLYLTFIVFCDSARILAVFPVPCHSHQLVFRPLTLELARQGHDVTVITPLPAFLNGTTPKNITEINIGNCIEKLMQKALVDDMKDAKDIYTQQVIAFDAAKNVFDVIMMELRGFLKSGQVFDLVLGEACARFTVVFSEIFKAPFVQVSSFGGTFDTFSIVGAPIHPLLYPLAVREKFKNLTVLDKLREVYEHYRLVKLYYEVEEAENEVARRHLGKEFPSMGELMGNVEIILLNVHPVWDSNRPVPPNLIYLGGLHLQKEKELPKELKAELDATKGVIYMSFGSTVRSSILSQEKVDMFLNVLAQLPYTVFWKWDMKVNNPPDNVIVRKWFPQADLLRHPKIKLFITQGGLQSIDEAIDAGVPMVGVPILWDQWYNVDKIVELEIGVMCDIRTSSKEDFKNAIETVLNNTRYKTNIEKLRDVINDQPQTSLQKAIWWIEHVIRHKGAKYLKSPAFDMSVTDYFEVYLILSAIAVCLIVFLMLTFVIKYSLNILCNKKVKQD
ncbi:unnamed protein product [Pieris macdunnoughi]|uniref:UDP-glucuronosyltransferase n=1 Tax=Pieris macdunnoughi TaxID=345717 RepID=A0A821ULJ6_9NEOP|nr:unnamed protein product [Pieris macdunnoughi]